MRGFYAGFMLTLLALVAWVSIACLIRDVLDCLRAAEGLRHE